MTDNKEENNNKKRNEHDKEMRRRIFIREIPNPTFRYKYIKVTLRIRIVSLHNFS
jgi:hypothetical protein